MSDMSEYGKISREAFISTILTQLGSDRKEVLQQPSTGTDFSAIRIARDKIMLLSCDPISYLPELGADDSAFISMASVTADLLTSSVEPAYAAFVLTLPRDMQQNTFRRFWSAISRECNKLGIAIVAGHTGVYDGCGYGVVGSAYVMAVARTGKYISSSMAKPGNKLIMTKTAGIETTFIFARSFPETVKREVGTSGFEEAISFIRKMQVYDDAIAATSIGIHSKGVTAMHDVAEGGVLGAIYELAEASSSGVMVYGDRIPVASVTEKICNIFSLNPLTTLGEGSMLVCCQPSRERRVLESLRRAGVQATTIGKIVSKGEGRFILRERSEEKLVPIDPSTYWKAYSEAKARGFK
jgi:hydrogenase maturation factor